MPFSEAFKAFIAQGWAPYPAELPQRSPAANWAAERRSAISARFPGERLVIGAGGLKTRSNDTDFRFRPHSAFAHLTGLGSDREPDAVLVLDPTDSGHDATLYFRPRAPRDSAEFYADARFGELWVGVRPSLEEMAALCGITCADIGDLPDHLRKDADTTPLRVLPVDLEPEVTDVIAEVRPTEASREEGQLSPDAELAQALSELRLTKDEYEVDELSEACRKTAAAFAAVVADLPEAVRRGRGERWVEGIFGLHARHVGNAVGYDTIAASGNHACTLHWIRNDGDVRGGDLILIDAGVEVDSLYTADVTRTLPVSGRFSDIQRKVYEAVLDAQEAGMAAVRPGVLFKDVHAAAIRVIAERLAEWGLLPVDVETALSDEGGHHRRWMVHGTSHHLGIDVHDCSLARRENDRDAELRPGMILTVEPGLYFKADDMSIPEELRGIGVRIEDDLLVTEDGYENLSGALPRQADDVERWLAEQQG